VRILVVEDEPKIAGFLERGLEGEGHRVDVVEDLEDARLVRRQPHDPGPPRRGRRRRSA
jgi:DNA-binding response OmpR family regulator